MGDNLIICDLFVKEWNILKKKNIEFKISVLFFEWNILNQFDAEFLQVRNAFNSYML